MDKIGIVGDHAGFDLKEVLKGFLQENGFDFRDYGPASNESVDYPDMIHPVAKMVDKGELSGAILICGSGNGVNMTANKYANVRSALCWNAEIAKLAKEHNNANCIAIPARFVGNEEAIEILNSWLHADFEGGRHERRVEKIPC